MNTHHVQGDGVRARLDAALRERVLILDGAMGTMIQRRGLGEADFRGERFAGHARDLAGDNDLLVLTRPDVIEAIHDEFLAAGADIIETNTFNGTAIAQADYGLEEVVYELNRTAARLARTAAERWTQPDAGPPALRGRGDRADEPHALDLARRQRRDLPRRHVRRAARRLRRAGPRADRRRLRPAADRDDLRHAERQGGDPGGAGGVRRAGGRAAADAVGDHHRPQRTHAVGPDHRRLLGVRGARPSVLGGHQLRARRARDAPVSRRAGAGGRHVDQLLSERRAAERVRRVRRVAGGDRTAAARVRRRRHRQHPGRLLRHDARPHPRRGGGGGRRGAARASGRERRARRRVQRAGAPHRAAGRQLPDGRRADQRDRLAPLRAPRSARRTTPRRPTSRWSRCAAAPTSST